MSRSKESAEERIENLEVASRLYGLMLPPEETLRAPLQVELVPKTAFYSNVRSACPKKEWDLIRRATYKRAGYECEVCGGVGRRHPVEAHETWAYDDERGVQTLEGMVALCPACHQAKHLGKANIDGQGERARAHLQEINGWQNEESQHYIHFVFSLWQWRSEREWEQDIGIIQRDRYQKWLKKRAK